jgi:hypothetical protein
VGQYRAEEQEREHGGQEHGHPRPEGLERLGELEVQAVTRRAMITQEVSIRTSTPAIRPSRQVAKHGSL